MNYLEVAFKKTNCDKGYKHGYHRTYDGLFNEILDRKQSIRILEIGIFRGASIEAFIYYLNECKKISNFEIVGVDLFDRVNANLLPIKNHPKVKIFKQDSTLGVPVEIDGKFDLIIDDGLHTPDAQAATFKNYYPLLDDKGIYVIEDIFPFDLMNAFEKRHKWLIQNSKSYSDAQYQNLLDTIKQGNLNTYKYHDYRKSARNPDSFLIEIRKNATN